MKKMTSNSRQQSWLSAIAEAAKEQAVALPSFTGHAMGSARTASIANGRFVTFKRRLLPAAQAEVDGIEWALWLDQNDLPVPVAAFREPLEAKRESVATVLSLLKGWLVDGWPLAEMKDAVSKHPRAQPVEELSPSSGERTEYWLSADRGFGIVVAKDRWQVFSRGKCLSSWRVKGNGSTGDHLDLASLDRLCLWVAKRWLVIAYGNDYRPSPLRGSMVAASRAYENAELTRSTEEDSDVPTWWSRHAIRAADTELPNVFFERQADDIVVSWNASPAPSRFYEIPAGEEAFEVAVVLQTLRRLVADRLRSAEIDPAVRETLATVLSSDVTAGYAAIRHYNGPGTRHIRYFSPPGCRSA
jgi:hypothetical protein